MDFFDKLGKKASETYKFTAEKTGKIAKEAKLKMKMNEKKSDIEDSYRQIGKKVYEKHLLQETINIKEELKEECDKIDALSQEIEDTLAEILGLRDIKKCPNCHDKIDINAKYCPNCGFEQPEIKVEEDVKEVEVVSDEENEQEDNEDTVENSNESDVHKETEVDTSEVVEEMKEVENQVSKEVEIAEPEE